MKYPENTFKSNSLAISKYVFTRKPLIRLLSASMLAMLPSLAMADLTELDFSNDLETEAAAANQLTYLSLLEAGCGVGNQPTGEGGQEIILEQVCTESMFNLFENVRELVHTANALSRNGGPTEFSLDLDLEGLGNALRWTAGEEFSSQGSLNGEFLADQVASLSSRLKALRRGAKGFGVSYFEQGSSQQIASIGSPSHMSGGGASADQGGQSSRWGGFFNADFGFGSKGASVFEDAYDFEGTKLSFGADYRYNQNWIFGMTGGLTEQEIDFDSSLSVVDGGIETDGVSLMPYAMYQSDTMYASMSLGIQNQAVDMKRFIKYPSLNPNVGSVNTVSVSSTDSSTTSFFVEAGYTYNNQALVIEPFVSLANSKTTIDGFTERDINDLAFDLTVDKQKIDSLEISYGVKFQYALTPSWGVIVPFVDFQSHHQQEDDSRNISSSYSNLPSGELDNINFNLSTSDIDSSYYSYSLGFSFVLRGDVYVDENGNSSGSIQGFLNYRSIEGIKNYSEETISVGLRYGF